MKLRVIWHVNMLPALSSLELCCPAQCWAVLEVPLLVLRSLACPHSTMPKSEPRSCPPSLRETQLAWAEQTKRCRWGHHPPVPSQAAQPLSLTEQGPHMVADFRLMCFTMNARILEQICGMVWFGSDSGGSNLLSHLDSARPAAESKTLALSSDAGLIQEQLLEDPRESV